MRRQGVRDGRVRRSARDGNPANRAGPGAVRGLLDDRLRMSAPGAGPRRAAARPLVRRPSEPASCAFLRCCGIGRTWTGGRGGPTIASTRIRLPKGDRPTYRMRSVSGEVASATARRPSASVLGWLTVAALATSLSACGGSPARTTAAASSGEPAAISTSATSAAWATPLPARTSAGDSAVTSPQVTPFKVYPPIVGFRTGTGVGSVAPVKLGFLIAVPGPNGSAGPGVRAPRARLRARDSAGPTTPPLRTAGPRSPREGR